MIPEDMVRLLERRRLWFAHEADEGAPEENGT